MTQAEALVDWRRRHELVQSRACDILGIRENTLKQWESGRRRPHPSALKLIAYTDKFGFIEETTR